MEINHLTRFLVATEDDERITLHVGEMGTSALQWKCRDLLEEKPIRLITRNEFWSGSLKTIRVYFEAKAGHVYELWHEGQPEGYYRNLHGSHVSPWLEKGKRIDAQHQRDGS